MYFDSEGEPRINDAVVDGLVRLSRSDPFLHRHILRAMEKPRDPRNVFDGGGCIDVSRECPKFLCRDTATISLPDNVDMACGAGL